MNNLYIILHFYSLESFNLTNTMKILLILKSDIKFNKLSNKQNNLIYVY